MRQARWIPLILLLGYFGCAATHRGTLVVYDASDVVVHDAVVANRSEGFVKALTQLGVSGEGLTVDSSHPQMPFKLNSEGVGLTNGVVLIRPGKVELERVIGWNWGTEAINISEVARELNTQASARESEQSLPVLETEENP